MFLVSGRIGTEHVGTIKELIGRAKLPVILDLKEVTLVERDVVPFLAACEQGGIEPGNCPAFQRDWIVKQRQRVAGESAD